MKKNLNELKEQASRISKDAARAVGSVKQAVSVGIESSMEIAKKASHLINKEGVGHGLDVTSKGVDVAAKGAKLASKGADALAKSMEKASKGIRKLKEKIEGKHR